MNPKNITGATVKGGAREAERDNNTTSASLTLSYLKRWREWKVCFLVCTFLRVISTSLDWLGRRNVLASVRSQPPTRVAKPKSPYQAFTIHDLTFVLSDWLDLVWWETYALIFTILVECWGMRPCWVAQLWVTVVEVILTVIQWVQNKSQLGTTCSGFNGNSPHKSRSHARPWGPC